MLFGQFELDTDAYDNAKNSRRDFLVPTQEDISNCKIPPCEIHVGIHNDIYIHTMISTTPAKTA